MHYGESAIHLDSAVAIWMPVLAVACLSAVGALDLEARRHTFGDTAARLRALLPHIASAQDDWAFTALVEEAEYLLLGEISGWAARRAFLAAG